MICEDATFGKHEENQFYDKIENHENQKITIKQTLNHAFTYNCVGLNTFLAIERNMNVTDLALRCKITFSLFFLLELFFSNICGRGCGFFNFGSETAQKRRDSHNCVGFA